MPSINSLKNLLLGRKSNSALTINELKKFYTINKYSGCWEWNRSKRLGYGSFSVNNKTTYAHRYFYELFTDNIIPDDMVLDHLCKNPGCVNPKHLEIVTQAINVRRGKRTKLSDKIVCKIRKMYSIGKHKQSSLADKFGVNQCEISRIINNIRWRNN